MRGLNGVTTPGPIAVIIPVFRHSVLLFDALSSLDGQEGCTVILVDDGCPNLGTQLAGLGLAASDPGIIYLRGANRGLSGARNRGIDYVLENLPEAGAIYFLDADNMLSPWSLAAMQSALRMHPGFDWFYPDINMFGLEWSASYEGGFLPLTESIMNLCEAGSLVRRRVFEDGLRFSETLKLGFEDWDFWLSAIEHGFTGRHFPDSGFLYRKRPESMLANSTRDEAHIKVQLEQRHPWVKDPKWAVAAEHKHVPRFAIYVTDLDAVRLTSSPDSVTEELSWADYVTRFWAALHSPKTEHAGAYLLITSSVALATLNSAGLLGWCLHDLQIRLRDANFVALSAPPGAAHRLAVEAPATGAAPQAVLSGVSMSLLRAVVRDPLDDWIRSVAGDAPQARVSTRALYLPQGSAPLPGSMLRQLVRAAQSLRLSAYNVVTGLPVPDCSLGTPDRAQISAKLTGKFGGGIMPPALARTKPEIALAVPHFAFGGVEKVTMFVAAALRRRGYSVSLLLCKARDIALVEGFTEAFDRVFFLDNPEFEHFTGPSYLGTNLPRWADAGEHANELNLLSAFDAVISCHAADLLGLMGELRRRGVVTGAYNHLFDATETGRHCGHPYLALAYEHALDLYIGCSRQILHMLHGHGVPAEKLVAVPNAPGIAIAPEVAQASLAARLARQGRRLNVLFMGRLDQQKGLDRLAAICGVLQERGGAHVRVLGRAVLSENALPPELAPLVEPPVQGDGLLEAYHWADILLLPSLYEGLPLTVIEAQRMGVVPIAAASGALAETVEDGVNGFLVPQETCVSETLARVAALTADRPLLHRMARAAASGGLDWDEAVAPLEAKLRAALARTARTRRAPAP